MQVKEFLNLSFKLLCFLWDDEWALLLPGSGLRWGRGCSASTQWHTGFDFTPYKGIFKILKWLHTHTHTHTQGVSLPRKIEYPFTLDLYLFQIWGHKDKSHCNFKGRINKEKQRKCGLFTQLVQLSIFLIIKDLNVFPSFDVLPLHAGPRHSWSQ